MNEKIVFAFDGDVRDTYTSEEILNDRYGDFWDASDKLRSFVLSAKPGDAIAYTAHHSCICIRKP